jgi:predicted acetyltransferase
MVPGDWEKLVPCYTAFAEQRSGLTIRTQPQWQRVLGENRPLTIYTIGDPVEAYAVVSHVTNFWTTDHISEIAWSTRAGYDGLLSVLGGMAINKTALSWFEPSDGPFYDYYLDQGIDVSLERPIMFRVTDVPMSIRSLKPDPNESGEFVVKVGDSLLPENEGPWRVRFQNGEVEVEKTTKQPDLEIDIRQFAQALLGEPGLRQITASGGVGINSGAGFTSACHLMPAQSTYCMDFF